MHKLISEMTLFLKKKEIRIILIYNNMIFASSKKMPKSFRENQNMNSTEITVIPSTLEKAIKK